MGTYRGGLCWSQTGTGTNGGATVVQPAAAAGLHYFVTGIQCSSDAAAVVTIESPAATVLWQKRYAAAFTMNEQFQPNQIVSATTALIQVKVSASSSHSEANIQGYTESN